MFNFLVAIKRLLLNTDKKKDDLGEKNISKNNTIKSKTKAKKATSPLFEYYIQLVMQETRGTKANTKANFRDARGRTGCTAKEYWLYRMYEMNDKEQETVLLASLQKHLRRKYDVNKAFVNDVLCDKEQTNICFSQYVKRVWCVNTKISSKDFVELFSNISRIIYKPIDGNRGVGVKSFDLRVEDINNVYNQLATLPKGVVEEYVVQHSEMLELCPSSVNTLRVVTFSSNSTPVTADGRYLDVAYASLRIGGGNSIVDNFHGGGMVSNVDLETGELITDGADMNRSVYAYHPATGVKLKGFKIPYFKEAMEMVYDAILKNRIEGYLGWDIAITENGPALIEVNAQPGVVLLQTPYAKDHKGMKHVLEKYL